MIRSYQTTVETGSFTANINIQYGYEPGEMYYRGEKEYWVPGFIDIVCVQVSYIRGFDSVGETVYEHIHDTIEPGWRSTLNTWALNYVDIKMSYSSQLADELRKV